MLSKQFRILKQTLVVVLLLVLAKVALHQLGWEVLSTTPLHTGLLAGSVFVLGFILTSIHADYKDSEKIPVDLTTVIENLYLDGQLFGSQFKRFKAKEFTKLLNQILVAFQSDINHHTNTALPLAKQLSEYFQQLEQLKLPANYIVRLKQEQGQLIRMISRMRYLQRIRPLPSAFVLVQGIVWAMITMLLFTKIGDQIDGIIVTAFLSFIYCYILQLISVMDTPFHPDGVTQDDVSLFLLEEQQSRLKVKQ